MHQLPVRAKSADPANLGTEDVSCICHCDDGCDYAVKDFSSGQYVPHSEWFCKHLGDLVGIASPECRLVEVHGGTAFGSRWESGHDPRDWVLRIRNGSIEKDRVAPTLSRIFAFDLFVQNVDRHTNNYIVRHQSRGWSFLAFDHSRAWMANGWPLPSAPMVETLPTTNNFRLISRHLGGILDTAEFLFVLNKIRGIENEVIAKILHYQHKDWLSQIEKDDILAYWRSPHFFRRLDRIEEGLNRGKYV